MLKYRIFFSKQRFLRNISSIYVFSSNQLHDYRKIKLAEQSIFSHLEGQKLSIVEDSELEFKEVQKCRQSLFDSLKTKRVSRGKDICKAEYDDFTKTITLTKKNGKLHQYMGYRGSTGATLLYPEEAVYLLDAGALELSFKKSPLSLEESFSFVLYPNTTWEQYTVYSQLSRAGFIVVRHRKKGVPVNMETEPISIPSTSASCSEELRSPPLKQGRYMDSVFVPCSFATTPNVAGLDQFESADVPSTSNNPNLAVPSKDLPQSKWNFNEISFPDSRGSSVTMISTPDFDCLPVLIEYNETRRVFDSRFFSTDRFKYHEKRGKREFYRPTGWTFVDVGKISNWKDFKDKKYNNRESRPERICDGIAPLLRGDEIESEVWRKLQIIKPITSFEQMFDSRSNNVREFEIVYDVHLSNSGFCFSLPTKPDRRLVIMKVDEHPPTDTELKLLQQKLGATDDVPLCFAVVDNGEILYFNIDLIIIPDFTNLTNEHF